MDAYVENPLLLKKRPKETIGAYVARAGIPVPNRFATLDDALASGRPFILRSEHPIEYAGPSGVFASHAITPERLKRAAEWVAERGLNPSSLDITASDSGANPEDPWYDNAALAQIGHAPEAHVYRQLIHASAYGAKSFSQHMIQGYCRLMNEPLIPFLEHASFSIWELLGFNRTIVADNAISGRYHLFTTSTKGMDFFHNYSIIDNGDISVDEPLPLSAEQKSEIPEIIEFYERIRSLSQFDPFHCPLIEFQSVGGEHYFLQYHRTRDLDLSSFALDQKPEVGDVEASFVRGSTNPCGVVVNAAFFYPRKKIRSARP